ncbi:hypothetical protein ACFE04_024392 [Oxalis oulophora]
MIFFTSSKSFMLGRRYHVKIVNNLTEPDQLDVTCHYRGKVHGPVLLEEQGQSFIFGFKINYIGRKTFKCDLWYPVSHQYHVHFVAFKADGDFVYDVCGETWCIWTATYEGIYVTNTRTGEIIFKYNWQLA